jgi:tetratricopeptide (TPR) repeat protein
MLFDLRGRGRRRTVQAIYLSLAVLMGGGLVLFGIGGNTSGGLFDAINGNGGSGGGSSVDKVAQQRIDTYNARLQANPSDQASWLGMTKVRFQLANTGENYNATQQAYTAKGLEQLRQADHAWTKYLALDPTKPDASTANLMVQAYGQAGLKQYAQAVNALEIVMDNRSEDSPGLYAQLAVLAAGANQTRKSELAEQKAIDLAPKDQRKQLKSDIDLAKSQVTVQQPSASGSG